MSHRQLRDKWLSSGGNWFDTEDRAFPRFGWDAWSQLDLAGLSYSVKRPTHTTMEEFPISIPGIVAPAQLNPEFENLHA